MDCQEWKDKDLSEGYKKFVEMLDQVLKSNNACTTSINMLIVSYSTQQQSPLDALLLIQLKINQMIPKVLS